MYDGPFTILLRCNANRFHRCLASGVSIVLFKRRRDVGAPETKWAMVTMFGTMSDDGNRFLAPFALETDGTPLRHLATPQTLTSCVNAHCLQSITCYRN